MTDEDRALYDHDWGGLDDARRNLQAFHDKQPLFTEAETVSGPALSWLDYWAIEGPRMADRIEALSAEVERLNYALGKAEGRAIGMTDRFTTAEARNEKLAKGLIGVRNIIARNMKLVEALRFYALWNVEGSVHDDKVEDDGGERARAALEEAKR